MPRNINKFFDYDRTESNIPSTILNFLAGLLAILALLSEQWIIVSNLPGSPDPQTNETTAWPFVNYEPCTSIGTKHFWLPARFGTFKSNGASHISYHYGETVLVDCITPLVADFFYILIALCFVVVIMTFVAGVLSFLTPPLGFLIWLRRNTILEICNVFMATLACLFALIAQFHVGQLRPESDVSIGTGMVIALLSSVLSFAAIVVSWRKKAKLKIARRLDNRRIMCHRTLRSWRDFNRHEDTRPIIDFERYLLEPTNRSSISTEPILADPAQLMPPVSSEQ
uniref:Transmembrane protein 127 transmembrane region domain-containing protein n=1 Tax=Acrobeloides nanus TaxID=290746 RepID=A0A914DQH4_9BILA